MSAASARAAAAAGGQRRPPTLPSFRRFVRLLLFRTIHDVVLMIDRERAGREASPTAGVIDSQTIKAPMAEKRGL